MYYLHAEQLLLKKIEEDPSLKGKIAIVPTDPKKLENYLLHLKDVIKRGLPITYEDVFSYVDQEEIYSKNSKGKDVYDVKTLKELNII